MDSSQSIELNYCYNCMTRMDPGRTLCPVCGHDNSICLNSEFSMPEGTILAGKYLVGRVLGQGGFGITYIGLDIPLDIRVAVKEYFPNGIAVRSLKSNFVTVVSDQGKTDGFRRGCDEFQNEAKRLAAFDSPCIVKVREYFRANGTAYIVMNYLDGRNLTKEAADCGGQMPWQRVTELFRPLILEIADLHEAHLIHRDIKPDNIKLVREKDGKEHLVLLDFGAARSFVSSEVTGSYSAVVTHGYAPPEQYSPKSRQGPYTDIYALCATMYALISGVLPATATDRMMGAAQISTFPELGIDVPERVQKAIFHGLALKGEDRPQSMRELYAELYNDGPAAVPENAETRPVEIRAAEGNVSVPGRSRRTSGQPVKVNEDDIKTAPAPQGQVPAGRKDPKRKNSLMIIAAAVLILAALCCVYLMKRDSRGQTPEIAAAQQTLTRSSGNTDPAGPAAAQETDMAARTETALEQTREAIAETQAAISLTETASALMETRQHTDLILTNTAAVPTKTPVPVPTKTASPVPTKTPAPTPKPTSTPLPAVKAGDHITLGKYEQNGNAANGRESIEWLVLTVENGRALVISRYGLDVKLYHESMQGVTWENCSMRKWLNGDFYDSAFSSEEKARIRRVTLKNPDNPKFGTKGGNDTQDRIFLLSLDEVKLYFRNDSSRKMLPTSYAQSNGAYVNRANGSAWWWLRSPGNSSFSAAGVDTEGKIYSDGVRVNSMIGAVRPAFWIEL